MVFFLGANSSRRKHIGLFVKGHGSVTNIGGSKISLPTLQTKMIFKAKDFEAFSSKNVCVYEEVALISGFQRPVICLLGASGIGRQTLRDMLIEDNPERYELAIPCKFVGWFGQCSLCN